MVSPLMAGTIVVIKNYKESPEFWDSNDVMMTYCGTRMTINGYTTCGNYSMLEDQGRWIWRSIDFFVTSLPKNANPNLSFKLTKGKKRK